MEKRAEFDIFFIDFHRNDDGMHIRAVVSNIGDIDGETTVNCYVKNVSTGFETVASSVQSGVISKGASCTVSLKFVDNDIAEKNDNFTLLKAGEYVFALGESKDTAVEVYSLNVLSDKYL
ncbi:MAG: hypothetical protein IJC20_01830 [Clostridia bacterium]|nr:hypothetical protein [Clostridia bacterium]